MKTLDIAEKKIQCIGYFLFLLIHPIPAAMPDATTATAAGPVSPIGARIMSRSDIACKDMEVLDYA